MSKRGQLIGDPEQPKPKLAIEMRLEELENIFISLVNAVEEMTRPAEGETARRELTVEDGQMLAELAEPLLSAPERIDQFVALIRNIEFREMLLRGAVKSAEDKARGCKVMVKSLKDAVELYMIERGMKKINGFASELALHKKPDRLEIHNEELIPDPYFDQRVTFRLPVGYEAEDIEELKAKVAEQFGLEFETATRSVNTDRLLNTLNMVEEYEEEIDGQKQKRTRFKEVHGAEVIRNEKRLSVK